MNRQSPIELKKCKLARTPFSNSTGKTVRLIIAAALGKESETGTWARLLGCGLAQPPPRSGWQSLPPNLESCFRSSDPTSRNFSSRNIGPKKWTQRLPQQRRINTAKLWAGRHVHHLRRHRWGRPATRCSPLKDGVIWIPRPSGRVLS